MRIVYLLESAGLWGGVKSVLETANRLQARGHEVTVLSRGAAPQWVPLHCRFETVQNFEPELIPSADVVIGTFWTTVPAAVACGKGQPVHYCQGYEGDNPECQDRRSHIELVYGLKQPHKLTISAHLTRTLRERFGCEAREIRYAIDHGVMFPGQPRPPARPVRIGLVGPYQIEWKDIATGLQACALAHRAGLELEVVRVTNTEPGAEERSLPFPVEWHQQVEPHAMGEIYRSMDVFVGSSRGHEEGFFLPAVEAMACGVPCVLTDIPCHRGYGDGQYALFVPPQNPTEMAEAVVIAAAHHEVRANLRDVGLETASPYNYDNHVTELEVALAAIAACATPRVTA